ncbi:hypothetical protein [Devosia sp. SD17-2]|uniref:hypothetical protein n=1 Tax=Devosia sp. SD17-2 TaxID=2976459 RepID=UPI0023D7BFB1|nr:hypothetical protein [Devosia sp. SD17-2]WEJ34633.1 hypothetical protein NYQ88_07465 [Devosia sp. SD17-2]
MNETPLAAMILVSRPRVPAKTTFAQEFGAKRRPIGEISMEAILRPILTTSIAAAIAVLSLLPSAAQSDLLGVPGPIAFQGESYALAWTSQPSAGYFKQEYLPNGQEAEVYRDMILVEAVSGELTPMDTAAAQIQHLEGRKASDPMLNYDLIQNDTTGEVLLDFLISDLQANPAIVEWNAYRYQTLGKGKGVALIGISRRGYGQDGATSFMTGLGAMRSEAINALAALSFPTITVAP